MVAFLVCLKYVFFADQIVRNQKMYSIKKIVHSGPGIILAGEYETNQMQYYNPISEPHTMILNNLTNNGKALAVTLNNKV